MPDAASESTTGVRAIGVMLERAGLAQVSVNVQDPFRVPLAEIVRLGRESAARHDAGIAAAEIVGLAPAAALEGFPEELELKGFDERAHVLEKRLTSVRG